MQRILAGFGESGITPQVPCDLSGYGYYLGRRATGVLDDLKARALFLQDQENNKLLLISCDLIGLPITYCDQVRSGLASKFSMPPAHILIACTHTHCGPPTCYLRGMGEIDNSFMALIRGGIDHAASQAFAVKGAAQATWNVGDIDPVGFNRVERDTGALDCTMGIIALRLTDHSIYLMNYACHCVTLGPQPVVSADFPGRLVRQIENEGNKAIFFQGFCGNIDPLNNQGTWGAGTETDMDRYGHHLAAWLHRLEKDARPFQQLVLSSTERRLKLPLDVPSDDDLKRQAEALMQGAPDPNAMRRFTEEWLGEALDRVVKEGKTIFWHSVPVQIMTIGDLKLINYPGEVFCELAIRLRRQYGAVFTLGYANGNIGYIPSAAAYEKEGNYACYIAPKLYDTFSFSPDIERIFLTETQNVLSGDR